MNVSNYDLTLFRFFYESGFTRGKIVLRIAENYVMETYLIGKNEKPQNYSSSKIYIILTYFYICIHIMYGVKIIYTDDNLMQIHAPIRL